MNTISFEIESNILSYLKTNEYKFVNKLFNIQAKSVENRASLVILKFIRRVLAEKKAIRYLLNYKNGCKISANICRKYVVKFYPSSIKKDALQYYLNMISRESVPRNRRIYSRNLDVIMSKELSHYIIFATIFIDTDTKKIEWISACLCKSKDNKILMYDMYDYFLKYKIMNS